jgi:hypothetical protein
MQKTAKACRSDKSCFNPDCTFSHSTGLCRKGRDCTWDGCVFRHPNALCRWHATCTNKECQFRHTNTIGPQTISAPHNSAPKDTRNSDRSLSTNSQVCLFFPSCYVLQTVYSLRRIPNCVPEWQVMVIVKRIAAKGTTLIRAVNPMYRVTMRIANSITALENVLLL